MFQNKMNYPIEHISKSDFSFYFPLLGISFFIICSILVSILNADESLRKIIYLVALVLFIIIWLLKRKKVKEEKRKYSRHLIKG